MSIPQQAFMGGVLDRAVWNAGIRPPMLGNFSCARYRFVLTADSRLRLNNFAGSTLRGGFGHIFKRTVCIWPPGHCRLCILKNSCAYPYIFETSPPPGSERLRNIDQIPRPFVIEPPQDRPIIRRQLAASRPDRQGGTSEPNPVYERTHRSSLIYQPGHQFEFRLILIGRAIDLLPYFLFTFIELGRVGLGHDRGRYTVSELHTEGPDRSELIFSSGDGVLRDHESNGMNTATLSEGAKQFAASTNQAANGTTFSINFLTPTRIRNDGDIRILITFQDLIRALLRRLSSLCYFHCGSELKVDFKALIQRAAAIRTSDMNLRWRDQERVSGRQRRRIEMGGIVGYVRFEASQSDDVIAFLPLLIAGEWVHVGKGCVMGLGRYQILGGGR